MDLLTIHILTFTSQNLLDANVNDLTIVPDQDSLGIWIGECHEDPGLTLVVVAGFPGGLDSQLIFGVTPKQQQRTEVSISAVSECLNAPVTEVASTILKDHCDHTQATSLIDAAMRTVLDADDCTGAVWKTSAKETIFFVGWHFLEAHQKYHQAIFANPPDCIKQLPSIVDTSVVFHVAFRQIQSATNKIS